MWLTGNESGRRLANQSSLLRWKIIIYNRLNFINLNNYEFLYDRRGRQTSCFRKVLIG